MAKIKPSEPSKTISMKKNSSDKKVKNKAIKKTRPIYRPNRSLRKTNNSLNHMVRDPSGVVYLSHIPHGFYEEQIKDYFSQFGKVTAVSVPRSKSGRARGYAFIEYKYPEIAKIAAETMNNYVMFNRLLKAKYIDPEHQKPRLFHIAKMARENHKTAAEKAALAVKHNRKLKNRHLKLGLEAKYAVKLLNKKKQLMKQAEKLGLSQEVTVGETDLKAIIEKQKTQKKAKKNKSNDKAAMSEEESETDASEEQFSVSESVDSLSEDIGDEDFSTENEEEDYKKVVSKAKKASKKIVEEKQKSLNVRQRKSTLDISPGLKSKNKSVKQQMFFPKGIAAENIKEKPLKKEIESSKVSTKSKELNTAIKDDLAQNENMTPKKLKEHKSINKTDITPFKEKTPRLKNVKALASSKKAVPNFLVMEVDNSDEEVNFKTPPNVVKKIIKAKTDSSKNKTREKSKNQSLLSPKNKHSLKEMSQRGVISPKVSPTLKSSSGKNQGIEI